ncbi:MAG: hypothetical protein JHC33_04400 [Ignisphaera sp.]|jgi:uncharacterized protein (UPF0335 family)|nr:hypothetical protein [Ignisphaera sp.]
MDSVTHPLTVEQLLLVISVLFLPAGGCVYWLASKITSLESEIKSMRDIKTIEYDTIISRVERLEKNIHEIRNVLQTLTFSMVRSGLHVDKNDPIN